MPSLPELDEALEKFEQSVRRMDIRVPLIEEALVELQTCEVVSLEGFLGFGRTLRCTEGVREALSQSASEEIEQLKKAVSDAKREVQRLQAGLAASPSSSAFL